MLVYQREKLEGEDEGYVKFHFNNLIINWCRDYMKMSSILHHTMRSGASAMFFTQIAQLGVYQTE